MVLSLKMTSHEPRYKKLEGEYEIMRRQEAGLLKPTVIQCRKVLRLNKEDFTEKKYGKASSDRYNRLASDFKVYEYRKNE